jgi:autotransporter-associated beta strand protein
MLALAQIVAGGAAMAASGTWTVDADGLWSDPANWTSSVIADGTDSVANFSTVDITGTAGQTPTTVTVKLDSPRTSGTLIFGDTVTSSTAGWIVTNSGTAANILTLASTSGTSAITVNALGTGKEVNISAILAGILGFIKNGNGTLVLSASNSISGPVSIAGTGSVLRLDSGGVLNVTSLTLSAPGASGTNQLLLNGGILTATGTTTVNPSSTAGRLTAIVINSGSAGFSAVSMGNSNGGLFNINGGNVTMASYDGGRAAAAPYTFTQGFVLTGGTAIVSGSTTAGNANNGSSMSIEGGSYTAQGAFVVAASPQSSNTASVLRVTNGRFTSTDTTTGFVLSNKSAVTGTAVFTGGVSTIDKLDMVINASGTGNVIVNGGSLYLGTGGWVKSNSGGKSNITLTSGTIGAKASWSSSLAMSIGTSGSDSITFKAADENNVAVSGSNDIVLSGSLSGLGSIVKAGAGSLTFNASNTYSGSTTVSGGTLIAGTNGALGASASVSVLTSATNLTISTGVTNAISDSATLTLAGGGLPGVADQGYLNLLGDDTVNGLILGIAPAATGFTYGSTASSAQVKNDEYFSGPGILTVVAVSEPGTWAMLAGSAGVLVCFRRFRKNPTASH